jgi:hypothetical protein
MQSMPAVRIEVRYSSALMHSKKASISSIRGPMPQITAAYRISEAKYGSRRSPTA